MNNFLGFDDPKKWATWTLARLKLIVYSHRKNVRVMGFHMELKQREKDKKNNNKQMGHVKESQTRVINFFTE